jgi:hypothetical protein
VADDLAIYERIAAALAEASEPDLSSFDPSQVRAALERVLGFPVPRQNFLAWLDNRVRGISGGSVSVQERPSDVRTPSDREVPAPPPGRDPVPELALFRIVQGEPFAEPAVVRTSDPVVEFTMRG